MRWLAILAICVAGAGAFLLWSLRDEPTTPAAHEQLGSAVSTARTDSTAQQEKVERPSPVSAKQRPRQPIVMSRTPFAQRTAEPAPSEQPSLPMADPVDASTDEIPDTDEQRAQRLYTARGRYRNGNYPGAIEAALELARRHPTWAEDGYAVAIQAYCALGEDREANALFERVNDASAVETVTKVCTEWNVKLAKSK